MELPPQILQPFLRLIQNQEFLSEMQAYISNALKTLFQGQPLSNQQMCPTALIMALSHCLSVNQSFSNLSAYFPEGHQNKFYAICNAIEKNQQFSFPLQYFEQNQQQLRDVKWQLEIYYGRQIWNITLIFKSGKKLGLKLNYQQLSALTFKVGQAVNFAQKMAA